MLRSLIIKLPALTLALLAPWLIPGAGGWALSLLALAVGTTLVLGLVLSPNASFWAPTRYQAPARSNAVALTFDDGPDPQFTPQVLEVLAARGVKAAFFVVGERVEQHPELVARIHREGHLIANHSHRHGLDFHFRLWSAVEREIASCNAAIAGVIGQVPTLFRSPQGFKNPALGDVLRRQRMLAVGWQARGYDAVERSAEAIERRVLAQVKPGGVVLLHDGAGLHGTLDRSPTLAALPRIIDELRSRGLDLVRLDALLGVTAYQASPGPTAPRSAALPPTRRHVEPG